MLDDRVTPERLHEVDADPCWTAEQMPTDRSVVGGYAALLGAWLVGLAAGAGLGAAVVTAGTAPSAPDIGADSRLPVGRICL